MKGLIVDLNGTLYFKDAVIEGAPEAIEAWREAGLELRFMTNTDSKTPAQLVAMCHDYGLDVREDEVFSAAQVTYRFLEQQGKPFTGLIHHNLHEDFKKLDWDDDNAAFVVVGDIERGAGYDELDRLFRRLMDGAELILMQPSRHSYSADGPHLDAGAFGALFEFASGQDAQIMGKPSERFFEIVLGDMGLEPHEVAVIGDDIESDIAGAARIGATSIMVKTGKYDAQTTEKAEVSPDLVVDRVVGVLDALKKD